MVMPIGPMKTTCLDCGWSCVTNQRSDAVVVPRKCQKCGGGNLAHKQQTQLTNLITSLTGLFK